LPFNFDHAAGPNHQPFIAFVFVVTGDSVIVGNVMSQQGGVSNAIVKQNAERILVRFFLHSGQHGLPIIQKGFELAVILKSDSLQDL
jgi:hypothetical protein